MKLENQVEDNADLYNLEIVSALLDILKIAEIEDVVVIGRNHSGQCRVISRGHDDEICKLLDEAKTQVQEWKQMDELE